MARSTSICSIELMSVNGFIGLRMWNQGGSAGDGSDCTERPGTFAGTMRSGRGRSR